MKIAVLSDRIPPEGKGGAERVVWSVATGLQRAGHDVHLIATTNRPSFSDCRAGIPVQHLHAGYLGHWQAWLSLYNLQTVGPLRAVLERLQSNVVHAYNIHLTQIPSSIG